MRQEPSVDPAPAVVALLDRKGGGAALAEALRGQKLPADAAKLAVRAVRSVARDEPTLVAAISAAGGITGGAHSLSHSELAALIDDVASQGSAARGETVFRRADQQCLKCHAIAGAGGSVGPDLVSIGASAQVDYLIESILQPSAKIKENYHSLTVVADGRITSGIRVRETDRELVLRDVEDREVAIPLDAIEEQRDGGSLMPVGLADTLTRGRAGRPGAISCPSWARWDRTPPAARRWFAAGKPWPPRPRRPPAWPAACRAICPPTSQGWFGTAPTAACRAIFRWTQFRNSLHRVRTAGCAVLRCQCNVATAGRVGLRTAGPIEKMWFDSQPLESGDELTVDMSAGTHTITLVVGGKSTRALAPGAGRCAGLAGASASCRGQVVTGHDGAAANAPGFLFATCQVGAEPALKKELRRVWPAFRFAYSRPGFLTFKLPAGPPLPDDFNLNSVFARTWGFSLGKATAEHLDERARAVWQCAGNTRYDALHVWQRDMAQARLARVRAAHHARGPASRNGDSAAAAPGRWCARDAAPAHRETWPARARLRAGRGRSVVGRFASGVRLGSVLSRRIAPAGAAARARRFARLSENERDAGVVGTADRAGQRDCRAGLRAGGASQALLERGLSVVGIDPAMVDPRVLAHRSFTHVQKRAADVRRRDFRGIAWLAADMNVAPETTLATVEAIVTHASVNVRGLLLTLKLLDWKMADADSGLSRSSARLGLCRRRARQLAHNRQEICVAAHCGRPQKPASAAKNRDARQNGSTRTASLQHARIELLARRRRSFKQ